MYNLGLKCAYYPEQLFNRLSYKPDLIEIQLFEDDLFGEKRNILEQTILMLKHKGIKVYLHHPIKYRGQYLDIIHTDKEMYEFYHLTTRILSDICNTYDIKCVIHPHYAASPSSNISPQTQEKMIFEIQKILNYSGNVFLWENTIGGCFTGLNPEWIEKIIKPLQLPIVFDISHSFISHRGDNNKLLKELAAISPYVKYFHVVDSMGQKHDSLPLGKGKINWEPILSYIKGYPYIYEVGLVDFTDAADMYRSHEFVLNLAKNII